MYVCMYIYIFALRLKGDIVSLVKKITRFVTVNNFKLNVGVLLSLYQLRKSCESVSSVRVVSIFATSIMHEQLKNSVIVLANV